MRILTTLAFFVIAISGTALAQASWSYAYVQQAPPRRWEANMACLESTGEAVLIFGSYNYSGGQQDDCWRFDGVNWTEETSALPPFRFDPCMASDAVRDRIVLFGGRLNSTYFQDTWEWDGISWTNPDPAVKPPRRRRAAMAFDRERGALVMFSGSPPSGSQPLHDIWEWDGTNWLMQAPPVPPSTGGAIAFDPVNKDLLVRTGGQFWSFDGTNWILRQPATPPGDGRMVTDLHRQRIMMYGDEANMFHWEWDGSEWSLMIQAAPSARSKPALAYDPVRRCVVMNGGAPPSGNNPLTDTWRYGTTDSATVVAYGAGCGGAAGIPELANAPFTLPWIGDTHYNRVTSLAPTSAGVFFVTGLDPTAPISLAPFGMPGCDQLVNTATVEFTPASNGMAEWQLTIPNSTALANVQLFQQVVALDSNANVAGLTVSNGVELTTGIR